MGRSLNTMRLRQCLNPQQLAAIREQVDAVHVSESLLDYLPIRRSVAAIGRPKLVRDFPTCSTRFAIRHAVVAIGHGITGGDRAILIR